MEKGRYIGSVKDKKDKKYSEKTLRDYKKETQDLADFAKRVSLKKLKGEEMLPDEQWKELQKRLLKREKKEKEMEKNLKDD